MSWRPDLLRKDSEPVPSIPFKEENPVEYTDPNNRKFNNTPIPSTQPNSEQYDKNLSNQDEGYERVKSIRRDTDNEKNFKVSIMDIDRTIIEHLQERLNVSVKDSQETINVPIIYSSPERWKSIRKDGNMRDKLGQVQAPLVVFKRNSIERNDQLITFNRYLSYPVIKKYSQKNKYDTFSVINNIQVPVKEIYNVTMPDHVIVTYDFMVWTNYIVHMNEIIEIINFATEDYWGEKNNYKFRTSIQNYSFENDLVNESDRIVKSTFSMTVYAYLLPEKRENLEPTTKKGFTYRKVVINAETSTQNSPKVQKEKILSNGLQFVSPTNGTPIDDPFTPTVNFVNQSKSIIGQFDSEDVDTYTIKLSNTILVKYTNYLFINLFNLIIDGDLIPKKLINKYYQNGQDFYIVVNKLNNSNIPTTFSKITVFGKFQ
jgi:hypothetical protein